MITDHKQRLRGILCFFLLFPFLQPFLQANDFSPLWPMGVLLGGFCLAGMFLKKKILRFPLYLIGGFWCLYQYYPLEQTFSFTWITQYWQTMALEIQRFFQGELTYLPEIFSLMLILILMALLTLLVIDYNWWFFAYLLIIGYFMMLAVFKSIDLIPAFVFVSLAAFLFPMLSKGGNRQTITKWFFLSSILLLITSIGVAFVGHTSSSLVEPLQEVSQPFRTFFNDRGLYEAIDRYGFGGTSRTGFSENDQQLGGPLLDNNEVVFTAVQEERHYWKIENKTTYTGRGWIILEDPQILPIRRFPYASEPFANTKVAETTDEIQLTLTDHQNYMPYAYGNFVIQAFSSQTQNRNRFYFLPDSQRFVVGDHSEAFPPVEITMATRHPTYEPEDLSSVALSSQDLLQQRQFLQLPDSLPSRVTRLADSLVSDDQSLYQQVLAIQTYLKSSGEFRYSKTDTPHLPEGRDYVDHFLFDTKVGYCDNFSSAMVVLLRSIGIPARWTKGFTSGQQTNTLEDGKKEFTVLNSDAHSWPEVYFPGFGWLPFEPTTTFSLSDTEAGTADTAPLPDDQAAESAAQSEASTPASQAAAASSSAPSETESNVPVLLDQLLSFLILLGASLLLTISVFLLFRYGTWGIFLVSLRFSYGHRTAYPRLLKRCERLLARQPSESLSDYAQRFTVSYALSETFQQVTATYEKQLYSNKPIQIDPTDYRKLVKEILKQLNKKAGR